MSNGMFASLLRFVQMREDPEYRDCPDELAVRPLGKEIKCLNSLCDCFLCPTLK